MNALKYDTEYNNYIKNLYNNVTLAPPHIKYLQQMYNNEIRLNVIYDIGACVGHWTKEAKLIWPNARIILIDAFEGGEVLFKELNYEYYFGLLSDKDDEIKTFYQNNYNPGGNSYYRQIETDNNVTYFPDECGITKNTITLDTLIKKYNLPYPDLIKIDAQGSEIDILRGAQNVLKYTKHLIVELPYIKFNQGAPLDKEANEIITNMGFTAVTSPFSINALDINGEIVLVDADHHYINNNVFNNYMISRYIIY